MSIPLNTAPLIQNYTHPMQTAGQATSTGGFHSSENMIRWFRKRLTGRRRRHEDNEVTCTDSESHIYEEIPDLIPTERGPRPQTDLVTKTGIDVSRLHQSTDFCVGTLSATYHQDHSALGHEGRPARHPNHLCDRIQNRYVTVTYNVKLKDSGDFLSSEEYVDMAELPTHIPSHKELQNLHNFRHACRNLAFRDEDSQVTTSVRNSTTINRQKSIHNSSRHKRSKLYGYKPAIPPSIEISSKTKMSQNRKDITAIYRPDKSQNGAEVYRSKNRMLSDIIRLNNDRQMLVVY